MLEMQIELMQKLLLRCMQARIRGSLKVFFYDTEAGMTQVQEVFARPRALAKSPYMLEVRPQTWLATCCIRPASTPAAVKQL